MKSKVLCVVVALTFAFGACNKDVADQIFDEGQGVNGVKKFEWVNPQAPDAGYLYMYGPILPRDFAHFESGGTQFNNEWMYKVPQMKGVYLFRDKNDKGNGWVKIFFTEEAKEMLEEGNDCDWSIGVR